MFEDAAAVGIFGARHDGSPGNVGRYQNRRHAYSQAVEVERFSRSGFRSGGTVTIRLYGRGHHVVVNSAMLVIYN